MASSGSGLAAGGPRSGSSSQHSRRRPLAGETLIPTGFELTAHPVFWLLLRQQPSPPRLQKVSNVGSKSALISLEPLAHQLDHHPSDQSSKRKEEDTPLCPICHKDHFVEPAAIIDKAAIEGKQVNEQCRHVFCYKSCIVPWFQNASNNTNLCPLCKSVCSWLLILTGSKFRLVAVGFDSDELQGRPFPSKEVLARARRRLEGVRQAPVEGEGEEEREGERGGEEPGKKRRGQARKGEEEKKREGGKASACNTAGPSGQRPSGSRHVLVNDEDDEEEEEGAGDLEGTGEEWLARELARVTRQIDRSRKKIKSVAGGGSEAAGEEK